MQILDPQIEAALVDPITRLPLSRATPAVVAVLNERLAAGEARLRNGADPPREVEGAYLTEDRRAAYSIRDGLANFMPTERIELTASL